ncbi:hypothetical protein N7499_003145 [Penicillium canescens]|uniref:Uncharacterized protein n=1 Tax=Penicillium canescens TaxID=5083 RepID=A0AAD6N8T5_PENCN|nr:hypothetical protein N7460_007069 [Penicillium canescens]KAJ6093814.1 hypothetical protein N7499_003145 [Penicillium canescens]KAJ6174395.1 hypothetical protein N7485_005461 [Penicillium canescens]
MDEAPMCPRGRRGGSTTGPNALLLCEQTASQNHRSTASSHVAVLELSSREGLLVGAGQWFHLKVARQHSLGRERVMTAEVSRIPSAGIRRAAGQDL